MEKFVTGSEAAKILGIGNRATYKTLNKYGLAPVMHSSKHAQVLYDAEEVAAARKKIDAQRPIPRSSADAISEAMGLISRALDLLKKEVLS